MAESVSQQWRQRADAEMEMRLKVEADKKGLELQLREKDNELKEVMANSKGFDKWQLEQNRRAKKAGYGGGGGGGGDDSPSSSRRESFLRVHWVAVPKALRARRANRRRRR
jgi:hypothetical protein